MEEDNSQLPTPYAWTMFKWKMSQDNINHDGETRDIEDEVQKIGNYLNDLNVSGPSSIDSSHEFPDSRSSEWASSKITSPTSSISSQKFLRSEKRSGPLHSYHRGSAIRMLTNYLTDLTTLNISLDDNLQQRVVQNRGFLKELSEANQREPNSPLTWQERNKLSLLLKDYQTVLTTILEDQEKEKDVPVDLDDVDFKVEKDVADGVPLYLYEGDFSDGGYAESVISALGLCETQVRECKKLLPVVRVYRHQCKNLVETLEPTAVNIFERCHKVLGALKQLEVDGGRVYGAIRKSVRFCFESLIGLARKFQMVVDLFRKCASENLHKTALALADLPPEPLMSRRWSEFSLAIRNCDWSMDLVELAFHTLEKLLAGGSNIFQDVSFKWCEAKCRMILQIQGKLGRQDSRLETSVLDVGKDLEAKDLNELMVQLRHLAESAELAESVELAESAESTQSTQSSISAESAESAESEDSANSAKLFMRQMLEVSFVRDRLLSIGACDQAKIANFLSEKLSGPIPHAGDLPWTFRVEPSSLKFREYLDSGGAGMVAKYTWFGENVAVKSVRSPGLTWQKFEEEASILAVVQHPNVVRLIGCGFIEKNNTGQLVMELMDHDLRTVIESRIQELGPGSSPFATSVAIDIILQIAQAMKHLKDHRVLHRDLKAKNILVNIYKPLNSGGESSTSLMRGSGVSTFLAHTQEDYVVKIIDFGLSKHRPHSSWVSTRMAGTTGWRAPEAFHVPDTDVTYEYKWPADVYSFAMTCYEILTGNLPFLNLPNQSIHQNVIAGKRPEGLDELEIPDLLKELVKRCWATNPDERPTFEDIVKSLWECRVEAIVPVLERHIFSSVSRSPSILKDRVCGKAGRPNLIGDNLVIDLTRDLLGVSSTGYVIRTSCSGGQGLAQPCALKRIDIMDKNRSDLARLKHPHVVQLIDHWIEERNLFLIMELMDGDLAKLMARTKKARASPFSLHVAVDLMLQIAKGMLYLHEKGVSHPHLKCENVLYRAAIKTEAYQVGDVLVKLGGFRCSRPADVSSRNRDVLCFGLTCLEILTGDERSDMFARSSILETTPAILKNCIVSCLDTQTTFAYVVIVLLRAKSFIMQTCKDDITYSNESIQTKIVPIKMDGGLEEIFPVHQLHPQLGGASTSVRATLIFFHGFHKVPEEWRRTWMTRDNKLVWPQKWLPEDLGAESIRVLSVSFDTNSNVSNNYNRYNLGKDLVQRLVLSPKWKLGDIEEALFLVGHSFGGVLIKTLVTEVQSFVTERVQNNIDQQEAMKCEQFLKSLAAIVFYSVPHAPMGLEFKNYISECRNIFALRRSSFLQSLLEDTRFIADMNQLSADFESAVPEKVKLLAFLEGKPMSKKRVLITEKSCEGLSRSWEWHKIDKDNHFEVCRPDSKNHFGYKILLDHLQQHMNAPCGLTSTAMEVKGPSLRAIVFALVVMGRLKRRARLSKIGVALPPVDQIAAGRTSTSRTKENTDTVEEGNSHPPTTSASDNIYHDDEARLVQDELQKETKGVNDPSASGPGLERGISSQEFLGSGKRSGPLHSYHRGIAFRMLTDYLADLKTLNISVDDSLQTRVVDNQAFLKELSEANHREPNSPLTWQERSILTLMLKDYQTALSQALEDQEEEDDVPGVDDVEFKVERDVADAVPLYLHEAKFLGGGYVESVISALYLCETPVWECRKLLPVVRVYRHQCKNLVETLEPTAVNIFERCHKVLGALKQLEVDGGRVYGAIRKSVRFCFESLIGLARKFQMVVDLFRKCASENLHKTALALADLPPEPLMSRRWSEFSLAIRNCDWSMDLVELAFHTLEKLLAGGSNIFQDVSFKWCEAKCRMILQIQGKLGRQDSRLETSVLDVGKDLEAKDLNELMVQLRHLAKPANGSKWKLSGLLSKAASNRANLANFLSEKLSGPIPHAGDLPWTFRVEPSSLKFGEYLDSGDSGMVAKYTWFGENVAVKSVRSPGLTWQKFEEEASILAVVQHPNVVRLIGCGFIEKNNTGQLVMELMDHDLRTVIESRIQELGPGSSPFATSVAIDIILQIAQAMKHLKDHRVLHRDLKAKNILVNIYKPLNSGGESSTSLMRGSGVSTFLAHTQEDYVVKIIDFGLSKHRPHSSWVSTRMAGTTGWRAPEAFHVPDTDVTYEYKWPADVYSFAMTCYEILTGNLPFLNLPNQSIHQNVIAGKRPEGLDELEIPDLLKELVKRCWATNPDERPTFEDIVKSLWECRVEAIVPYFERHM